MRASKFQLAKFVEVSKFSYGNKTSNRQYKLRFLEKKHFLIKLPSQWSSDVAFFCFPYILLYISRLSLTCSHREMPVYDLGNITSKRVDNAQAWVPGFGNSIVATKASEKSKKSGACHFNFTSKWLISFRHSSNNNFFITRLLRHEM